MRFIQYISCCLFLPLLLACNNAKENGTRQGPITTPMAKDSLEKTSSPDGQNSLVGTWKLQLDVFDDNQNQVMEEEERKKGFKNNYVLQLKADGSCRLQQTYDGRYEVKTEKGKQMLYVYRKKLEGHETKDPVPDIYEIKSVKGDELILMPLVAGFASDFWIFKKA